MWEAMKLDDILNKSFNYIMIIKIMSHGNKMVEFSEFIYYHHHHKLTLCLRQPCDEVHTNGFPNLGWHI